MEARIKFILLLLLALMWGGAQWAKADDELSCVTDNECIKQKVNAGYDRWEQEQQANQKYKSKKRRVKAQQDQEVKPCAADDDCQRSKLDAVDRENGKGGQED